MMNIGDKAPEVLGITKKLFKNYPINLLSMILQNAS